jgi:hypothetical protein
VEDNIYGVALGVAALVAAGLARGLDVACDAGPLGAGESDATSCSNSDRLTAAASVDADRGPTFNGLVHRNFV